MFDRNSIWFDVTTIGLITFYATIIILLLSVAVHLFNKSQNKKRSERFGDRAFQTAKDRVNDEIIFAEVEEFRRELSGPDQAK